MNPKLLSGIVSICIVMIVSCSTKKSPTSFEEMDLPKQLTSTEKDHNPFLSPDGEHIAFLSFRNTYNPNVSVNIIELWIMAKDGSNQRALLSKDDLQGGTVSPRDVSWNENSREMVVQISTAGGSEIWRVNLDGNRTRLSSIGDWAERPQYSPDGSKIAYLIQGPNPPQGSPVYRLYVSDTDLSEPVLLETGLIRGFEWRRDSNGILYSLYDQSNENDEIWKTSISGNEKVQFSNTSVSETELSYSSDGKYITYSVERTVYITPSDTFQPERVIDNARIPLWIPNRDLILISIEQSAGTMSWTGYSIVDLEGNIVKVIGEGRAARVSFLSDGVYFVYTLDGNLWVDRL